MAGQLSAQRIRAGLERANKRLEPQVGTQLRALWDLFQAHKGQVIEVRFSNRPGKPFRSRMREDLRDYYGLDIRSAGYGQWQLVGQWMGDHYTSYVDQSEV